MKKKKKKKKGPGKKSEIEIAAGKEEKTYQRRGIKKWNAKNNINKKKKIIIIKKIMKLVQMKRRTHLHDHNLAGIN